MLRMLLTPEVMSEAAEVAVLAVLDAEDVRLEKSRLVRLDSALVTDDDELDETSPAEPATRPRENCL